MTGRAESRRFRSRRLAAATCAVVIGAVAILGCPPNRTRMAAQPPMPERPECPTHELALPVFDSVDHGWVPRIVTDIPIGPTIDEVPEYHDCQRLVRQHEPNFGPLVGIFAAEGIATLFGDVDETGRLQSPADRPTPKAVAQIFNFDDEPYAPLAIRREFNCLYLSRDESGNWKAFMVWARSDDQRCLKPLDASGRGGAQELDVFAHDPSDYTGGPLAGEDIPAVARWDFDDRGRHAIGIRCAHQWCTIVPRGAKPQSIVTAPAAMEFAASTSASAADRKERRIVQVRGWYDEQQLATTDASVPHGLAPGGPKARLFPHPELGEWNDPDDFDDWRTVAFATVVGGSAGIYEEKLNLGTNLTTYDLIHRDTGESAPAELGSLSCPAGADGTWFMRLTRLSTVKYGCVTQRPHPEAASLPGTVRWRWKVDDETMWVRCPGGCCTLER